MTDLKGQILAQLDVLSNCESMSAEQTQTVWLLEQAALALAALPQDDTGEAVTLTSAQIIAACNASVLVHDHPKHGAVWSVDAEAFKAALSRPAQGEEGK